MVFSGVYVGWQLVMFAIGGFNVSSALLHLIGFAARRGCRSSPSIQKTAPAKLLAPFSFSELMVPVSCANCGL